MSLASTPLGVRAISDQDRARRTSNPPRPRWIIAQPDDTLAPEAR